MTDFTIDVLPPTTTEANAPRRLSIRAGECVFTRLLRPGSNKPDDYLCAPPQQFAFWLIDNWWRLRWESLPIGERTPAWRLAHELASIGGGYVWPRLTLWGEGDTMGVASMRDPAGIVGPVRYLTEAQVSISASGFEQAVDRFLDETANGIASSEADRAALSAQIEALRDERNDPAFAAWRRMEAQSGFDPDDAPESLMTQLAEFAATYGEKGVEEAVQAHPGLEAARVLGAEIAAVNARGVACQFDHAVGVGAGPIQLGTELPWQAAEVAGQRIRGMYGFTAGPLGNEQLADLLGVTARTFDVHEVPRSAASYGLRVREGANGATDRLALCSNKPLARRFELVRALGDAVWAGGDPLGPIAQSTTARQQFQRAFAQSVLCPFKDLIEHMGTKTPSDDDVEDAARYFNVSESVVKTLLVNKRVVDRDRFSGALADMVQ